MIRTFLKRFGLLFVGLVVLFVYAAIAQTTGDTSTPIPAGFPYLLAIPLVIGMMAHWMMAYIKGTVKVSLWQYIIQGVGWTIGAFSTAVGSLAALWALNPAGYNPAVIGTWIQVIFIGYGIDSAVNNVPKTTPPTS